MTPFWIGFLLGAWVAPCVAFVCLCVYAHLTRRTR
jgi:hypothetical protein